MARTPKKIADNMKRFQSAIKGVKLSYTVAYEINNVLGTDYVGEDKLRTADRARLAQVLADYDAKGYRAAKSLLSTCQRAALNKKGGR